MLDSAIYELKAWKYLLSLPRLDWKKHGPIKYHNQIQIRIVPGKLYGTSGAPFLLLFYTHPDCSKRFRTTGNNLVEAVRELHSLMRNQNLSGVPECPSIF